MLDESTISDELDKPPSVKKDLRVLVIDDEPLSLEWIRFILEEDRLYIDDASSIHEALDKLTSNSYDLVVTDLYLGSTELVEGLMIVERCKEDRLPCIVVTANQEGLETQVALDLGAAAVFQKPVARESVLRYL